MLDAVRVAALAPEWLWQNVVDMTIAGTANTTNTAMYGSSGLATHANASLRAMHQAAGANPETDEL
jgi:hypothetical protein